MTRDLRKYTSQTDAGLAIGAILILTIVGLGLVWIFYGAPAAVTGLLCALGGLLPIALIVLLLKVADWIVRRARRG